jgi:hexosaminidase
MDQVRSYGLTPLVWQEMLLDWNLTLPSDTIVQTWISPADVAAVTAKGYRVLVGQYDYWYLDCGHGQWLDFYPGASSRSFWPYLDYCNPLKNWRLMYSYDPLNNVPADQQHLVLGGETHIWSEQTDAVNLDETVSPFASLVHPRMQPFTNHKRHRSGLVPALPLKSCGPVPRTPSPARIARRSSPRRACRTCASVS